MLSLKLLVYSTSQKLSVTVSALSERWPLFNLLLRTSVLFFVFFCIDQFMLRLMRLPEESYHQPFLALNIAQRLGVVGCFALIIAFVVLARFGRLLDNWNSLQHGRRLRWFVLLLAIVIAWPLVTFGFNYFHGQGYWLDRLLLLILLPLIWLRPVFVYPFLMVAFAMLWQLGEPLLNNGSHFAHKLQVLHVLNLFAAMFLVYVLIGWRRSQEFYFFVLCLVAAAYWQPAVTKLQLDWLWTEGLFYMPLAAHAHGWLSFIDPAEMVKLSGYLKTIDWPARVFVLALEVGSILILFSRRYSVMLLLCLSAFHLAVFALYGFLFWTWIVLNLAVVLILWRDRKPQEITIFSRSHLLMGAALIYFAPYWCSPPSLGWYDTRLSYTYRYEATGESGTTYTIPPRFFAPYGDVFTMANFNYLNDQHLNLVSSYGITGNWSRAEALLTATTAEQVFVQETSVGANQHHTERADKYYQFVQRYLQNRNQGDRDPSILQWLRAPAQFWNFPRGNPYTGQEPLREVVIKEVTTLFDDHQLREIREIELNRISLSD
jgi:hypothetical protein